MRNILHDLRLFDIDAARLRSPDFFKNMLEYRDAVMERFAPLIRDEGQFLCLLCGGTAAHEFLRYQNYPLFECEQCSAVTPNIDTDKVLLAQPYDDPIYIRDTTREILDTYEYRKATYAPERLAYVLEKTGLERSRMKLLDVGCGPGYFLSHLKDQGISARGVELARFLVDVCRARDLDVDDADLDVQPDGAYNAITLFDVLEHLAAPIDFMRTLFKKLEPGGYVVAYVPHIHSVAFHLMKGMQNTLAPFQHLCFYDEKSLDFLALHSGFRVKCVDYFGLDVVDYLCMKESANPSGLHEGLKDLVPVVQAIIDKQKLSNHMRVTFQKCATN